MAALEDSFNRPKVSENQVLNGLAHLKVALERRLAEKGQGSYASRHEVVGILAEEYDEMIEAVRLDGPDGYQEFQKELLDIAVGAIFGFICLENKHIRPRSK